jgi:membrane associated rhomboid family serine protease
MDPAVRAIATFLASVVGLAVISVIFSPKATAAAVIGASGNAVSGILEAAESPVTGTS